MKELEFMEKINDLDPALLEDRPAAGKRFRGKTVRRIVIAAAAVLALGGTVYGVAKGIELRRISRPGAAEEGIEARAELAPAPWSSFTGEIRTAGEQIVQQYENYTPEPDWSSRRVDPGVYARSFGSLEEAAAYLGLEGFRTPPFPYDDCSCTVSAHGDEKGTVDQVRITAEHIRANEICAQEFITILTDAAEETELVSESFWTYEFPRDVEFQHYATPGGSDCAIAVLTPEFESKYMGLTAHLTVGGVFYELNLSAVPKERADEAMRMLYDWADALDK